MARPAESSSSSSLQSVLVFFASIAILYFARQILIPLALALLFAFLFAPVVRFLESLRLGRVVSVVIVIVLSFAISGAIGWIVVTQLVNVTNSLPKYAENIRRKMETVRGPKGGSLATFVKSVQDLSTEFSAVLIQTPAPASAPSPLPTTTTKKVLIPKTPQAPVVVQLPEQPSSPVQAFKDYAGSLLSVLETAAIVAVFTIFMLMERDHLRNRLFRLAGMQQINLMTQALDDAGQRVSRYLLMQGLVNALFGTVIGLGLYFIGVPNAWLWGALAALLRFLPYIGPLIGGLLPFILALAVFDGWRGPIMTFGLFLTTELLVGNVIEPWLYGAHTGISSLAILVAAVFWTGIWGTAGLVLSTPLTVCLVVLGRHVPQLEFLNVLLGDDPGLPSEAHFYQRLLAMDSREAHAILESMAAKTALVDIYDCTIVPALGMAEQDRHSGALTDTKEQFIVNSINESVLQLASKGEHTNPADLAKPHPTFRILCVPAKDSADEVTAAMLAQLLEQAGFMALSFPVVENPVGLLRELATEENDVIFISSLPPFALLHAQRLNKELHEHLPGKRIIVGLWNYPADKADNARMARAFGCKIVTTLREAVAETWQIADPDGDTANGTLSASLESGTE